MKKRTKPMFDTLETFELHLKYLFGQSVNFRDRTLTISEDIKSHLFEYVDNAISEMEVHSTAPITIKLNSYGGLIHESMAIIGRIRSSSCKIHIEAYGKVMSAGFMIFAAGHERKISKYAVGMFHIMSYGTNGTHTVVVNDVAQNIKEVTGVCKMMSEFSNKTAKYWRTQGKHVDKYYTPEEMIEIGVADEII